MSPSWWAAVFLLYRVFEAAGHCSVPSGVPVGKGLSLAGAVKRLNTRPCS